MWSRSGMSSAWAPGISAASSGPEPAALIPGAQALDIPDRDHMLAVGDKAYKTGVLEFLDRRA